jgi:ectoine hydroxylase
MTMSLPAAYRENFALKGHFEPVTLFAEERMSAVRTSLEAMIAKAKRAESSYSEVRANTGDGSPVETIYDAHLSEPAVRELATHPTLVSLARELLGGPVKLWRTTFWIKEPGARRLEWHQDTYKAEGFGSFPNVNAWIAIDPTTEANAVRMASGTHREIIDLAEFGRADYVAAMRAGPELPSPLKAPLGVASMVLKAGQCFVFDGRVLHGSPPNRADGRRAGIVVRFIPADLQLPGLRTPCLDLG